MGDKRVLEKVEAGFYFLTPPISASHTTDPFFFCEDGVSKIGVELHELPFDMVIVERREIMSQAFIDTQLSHDTVY
jgi:hypothetical protein